MRLRLYGRDNYNGQTGRWERGEEKEVGEQEAHRLLASFPEWFEAVGGQAEEPAVGDAESAPEKSLPAAPRKKPFRGKGK